MIPYSIKFYMDRITYSLWTVVHDFWVVVHRGLSLLLVNSPVTISTLNSIRWKDLTYFNSQLKQSKKWMKKRKGERNYVLKVLFWWPSIISTTTKEVSMAALHNSRMSMWTQSWFNGNDFVQLVETIINILNYLQCHRVMAQWSFFHFHRFTHFSAYG